MNDLKILVVEDDHDQLHCLLTMLKALFPNLHLNKATTLDEFRSLITRISDFSILIVDSCLCSRDPNTPAVISEIIEKGFKGQIIGVSNNEDNLTVLYQAGCNQVCLKAKFVDIETLKKIIGKSLTKLALAQ